MKRAALAIVVAISALSLAAPAPAQVTEQAMLAQCAEELGYTVAECACVMDTVRPQLTERQVEYFIARVTRNGAEVQRMRIFMGLFERLGILLKVMNAADICAPNKPLNLPEG
jgi:hypothetical protein